MNWYLFCDGVDKTNKEVLFLANSCKKGKNHTK